MSSKTTSFAVRLDYETGAKLQELAEKTDRTMSSVIRVLIRLAEVGNVPEVGLPAIYVQRRGDHSKERSSVPQPDTG